MKKFLSVLIAAALVISLAGCGIKITIETDKDVPNIIDSVKDKAEGLFGKDKEDTPDASEDPEPENNGGDSSDDPAVNAVTYTMDYDSASQFFDVMFSNMTSVFCDSLLLDRSQIEDEDLKAVYTSYPVMAGLDLICSGLTDSGKGPKTLIDSGYSDFSNGYDGMVAAGICTQDDAKYLKSGDMGDSYYAYYRISDLQPYIDYIYGSGRVDTSKWSNEDSSDGYISYYVTGTGYILYHTGIGDMSYMLSSITNITLDGDKADITYKRFCVYPWDGEVEDSGFTGHTDADTDKLYDMKMSDAYNEVLSKANFNELKLTDRHITLFMDADGVHIYETFKG